MLFIEQYNWHLIEPTVSLTNLASPLRIVRRSTDEPGAIMDVNWAKSRACSRGRAVDRRDDIARFNSGRGGGAAWLRRRKDCPIGNTESLGKCRGHRRNPNTNPSADGVTISPVLGCGDLGRVCPTRQVRAGRIARSSQRLAFDRADGQPDVDRLTVAHCVEVDGRTWRHRGNQLGEITRMLKGRAVDRRDDIERFNSGPGGGAAWLRRRKDCPVGNRHTEAVGKCRGHRRNPNTNPSAGGVTIPPVLGCGDLGRVRPTRQVRAGRIARSSQRHGGGETRCTSQKSQPKKPHDATDATARLNEIWASQIECVKIS